MTAVDPIALSQALIRCQSVTPRDDGAIGVVASAAAELGFTCHRLAFSEVGHEQVQNLYARLGTEGPNFCFAGHTDVVPPGNVDAWSVDPFGGAIRDGLLYGRGAADMKSAVAAFVAAVQRFLDRRGPDFGGSISLLITGDEEGDAVNGTRKVLDWLVEQDETLDACLVGEPTSAETLGDTLKNGRRGSLVARLTVRGVQGHAAYPQFADNPVNRMVRMLAPLIEKPLDDGTEHFQPSNVEITSADVGNTASNVVPARARATINIRFNDTHDSASLTKWLRDTFDAVGGTYELGVRVTGEAFLTPPGPLTDLIADAVERTTGRRPELSTGGGTSDARFIKDHCPVVEMGVVNRTIHKIDEHAAVADIERLTDIYTDILNAFFPANRD